MDIHNIISEHLKQHEFEGLYNDNGECACKVGSLAPCDGMAGSCHPGYLRHITTGDGSDFYIQKDKPKQPNRLRFRAWNGRAMEHGGFLIHATGKVMIDSELSVLSPDSPVMQSTGEIDQEGKEIYEGDIVEINRPNKDYTKGYVKWRGGHACGFHVYGLRSGSDICLFSLGFTDSTDGIRLTWTVIGNIYANPELLEGGRDD